MNMKNELEICVKCLDTIEETLSKLKSLGFTIKEDFILKDTYYVKNEMEVSLTNSNNLFSNYVLIRESNEKINFVLKEKNMDEDGAIINQSSCKCPILDKVKGDTFIKNLGYKELLKINDHNYLLSNGKNEVYVQDVENLGAYIEMEQKNIYSDNNNGNNIDEMISILNSYKLKIKTDNYFVKKSLDMLEKVINES